MNCNCRRNNTCGCRSCMCSDTMGNGSTAWTSERCADNGCGCSNSGGGSCDKGCHESCGCGNECGTSSLWCRCFWR